LEQERAVARTHDAVREGVRLGLIVATTIWIWLAAVDAIVGEPFRTFTVLGGVGLFTVLHYVFNVVYAVVIVWAIHGAAREPSLAVAVAFGFFIVEFGFAMLTVLLSHLGLGELAWVRILGGNLIGAVVAFVLLFRAHPLARELKAADRLDED
jgi:hypothetical protein